MTRIAIFMVFICLLQMGIAHSQNPFDIPARLNEDSISINAESPTNPTLDTLASVVDSEEEYDLSSENPFDVSHIPLIKTRKTTSKPQRSKVGKGFFVQHFSFLLLILSLIIISIITTANRQYIRQLFSSLTNQASQRILDKTYNNLLSPINLMLYLVFFINLALLLHYLLYKKGIIAQGWQQYIKIVAAIAIIYSIKHLCIWFIKNVFNLDKYLSRYSSILFNTNHIIGIILILANFIILYSFEQLAYITALICIVMVLGLYFLRLIKASFIASPLIASNGLHYFIYLCGFEIVPVLVLWRMITNNEIPI